MMERWNSEGIPRDELPYALRTPRIVRLARRMDKCLLCCRREVNEAGLCTYCYSTLDGAELDLATRWLSGVGP